jgi:RimJ/RimL family protein N-acetyltransferase
MIGACGFIFREGWDEPELGWNLHDGYEGKGYAFEAASAARAYGAKHFDLSGVISYIDPVNRRSIALAKRLGATFERKTSLLGQEADIYRHPKSGDAS